MFEKQYWKQWLQFRYVVIVLLIGLIAFGGVVWMGLSYRYHATNKWYKYKLDVVQADVPPSFVQDRYDRELKNKIVLYQQLQKDVSDTLKNKRIGRLTEKHLLDAKKYEGSEDIQALTTRIEHYRQVLAFSKTAYETLDNETLHQLMDVQLKYQLDKKYEEDTAWLSDLTAISGKYLKYLRFVSDVLPQYGRFEGDFFKVHDSVLDLNPLREELKAIHGLRGVTVFEGALNGNSVANVLNNNYRIKDYQEWQNALAKLEALKGDYWKASDVKTVKDAREKGLKIQPDEPKFAKEDSPVKQLLWNQVVVEENEYVRSGLGVVAVIDWKIDEEAKEKSEKEKKQKDVQKPADIEVTTETTAGATKKKKEG